MSAPPLVRAADPADAPGVAALHAAEIPEGFLVTLGPRFLRALYARIARSEHGLLLVADGDGDGDGGGDGSRRNGSRRNELRGFVAAALDTGALYREFLRRDALRAGLAAAPALARAPRRGWETWRYGRSPHDELPAAEVLAVAVSPRSRGRGVGAALLSAAQAQLVARGVGGARVVTAAGNEAALALYARAEFSPRRTIEVHAGVEQVVLAWP